MGLARSSVMMDERIASVDECIAAVTQFASDRGMLYTQMREALSDLINPTKAAREQARRLGIEFSSEGVNLMNWVIKPEGAGFLIGLWSGPPPFDLRSFRYVSDHAALLWSSLSCERMSVELGNGLRMPASTAVLSASPQWLEAKGGWCDVFECENNGTWENLGSGHWRCADHPPAVPNGESEMRDGLDVLATQLQVRGDAMGDHIAYWLVGRREGTAELVESLPIRSKLASNDGS